MPGVQVERLDHLGIVAGVCQEMRLAAYLDGLAGPSHQQVCIGTATVAMILNGLGFSNRRLYLVSQFFATKPVEHLLGPRITAEMLHDDCLGRTLDWLYAHDPTALCAGIAHQARARFAVSTRQVHVDTTSFAVSGEYAPQADAQTIAVTYGYSRDHRADLKQWMLALATTRDGDVPLFCWSLDGNSSDKVSLVATVEALAAQLQASTADDEARGQPHLRCRQRPLQCGERRAPEYRRGPLGQPGARDLHRSPGCSGRLRQCLATRWRALLGSSGPGADGRTLGHPAHHPRREPGTGNAATQGGADPHGMGTPALAPEQPSLCLPARRPGGTRPAAQGPSGVA